MNKKQVTITFVTINVFFILAHIYKHTQVVKYTYMYQSHEKKHSECTQELEILTQQLCALKNKNDIQKFAQKKLNMTPIALKNVKRIPTV